MWRVETRGLSKRYGAQLSLDDCTLQIPEGCVFGLLGPNGAGKSTLLRILLGFLRPTAGSAWLGGFDVVAQTQLARAQASYLPGDARLMRSLRGIEQLRLLSGLHPLGSLERARAIAERLQLDVSRRVMFMSTGMRQKLAIASVLGCQAPVVVLDEPTANLDPDVRRAVLGLIQEIRREGRTVLLSSHIFSDIDATCDQVAILQRGRVVAQQAMADVQQCHIVHGEWQGSAPASLPPAVEAPDNLATGLPKPQLPETPLPETQLPETQLPLATQVRELPLPAPCRAWLEHIRSCPWVSYFHAYPEGVCPESACPEEPNFLTGWQLELHLVGAPESWLTWLQQQPVRIASIERGGIRAVYERYQLTELES